MYRQATYTLCHNPFTQTLARSPPLAVVEPWGLLEQRFGSYPPQLVTCPLWWDGCRIAAVACARQHLQHAPAYANDVGHKREKEVWFASGCVTCGNYTIYAVSYPPSSRTPEF
jgi:hypothetical protein